MITRYSVKVFRSDMKPVIHPIWTLRKGVAKRWAKQFEINNLVKKTEIVSRKDTN